MSTPPKKNNDYWAKNFQKIDERTFKMLFEKYYPLLTRFVWRYVNSKAVAEGLIQELFTILWEKRNELDMKTEISIRSYMYRSARNLALNHLKHQKIKDKYDSIWANKKENPKIEYKENYNEIRIQKTIEHAIEQLPTRSKMVFKLSKYDGLTYEEIALVMNISVKTVESQMTRTLKKLRLELSHLL